MILSKVLFATALLAGLTLPMAAQKDNTINVSIESHITDADAVGLAVLKETVGDLQMAGVHVEAVPADGPPDAGLLLEIETVAADDKTDVVIVDASYKVDGIDVPFHLALTAGKVTAEDTDAVAAFIVNFAHAAYEDTQQAGLDALGGAKT